MDSVTKTELMFLHYMTSVSKGLHVEKILGRNLKNFFHDFPPRLHCLQKNIYSGDKVFSRYSRRY